MKTTLETSEYENYTRNEWRWKLHSERVNMKTTLETSEDENYTKNEWKLYSSSSKVYSFFDLSEMI